MFLGPIDTASGGTYRLVTIGDTAYKDKDLHRSPAVFDNGDTSDFKAKLREACAGFKLDPASPLIGAGMPVTWAYIKSALPLVKQSFFEFNYTEDFFGNRFAYITSPSIGAYQPENVAGGVESIILPTIYRDAFYGNNNGWQTYPGQYTGGASY